MNCLLQNRPQVYEKTVRLGMVMHTFNPRGRGGWVSEFEDSLVYIVSSRTANDIERDPVSKKLAN